MVYRRILDEIRAGGFTPGQRLREVEIAGRLGHSRTPVREALRLLEADGLVVHQPRLGATLRKMDHPEVMELYEMRAVLEGTAARLAARVASTSELLQLSELNEELGATEHEEQAAKLNRQFHAILMEAARNRFLLRSMHGLHKTMLLLGQTTLMDAARIAAAREEHRRIIAALEARDGAAAEAAMRGHLEAAQVARLRSLRRHGRPLDK